ncbi:hypothetical protein [Methanoculleus sp.]|nr:hypothetical protein [Methanoculleus sp.]
MAVRPACNGGFVLCKEIEDRTVVTGESIHANDEEEMNVRRA